MTDETDEWILDQERKANEARARMEASRQHKPVPDYVDGESGDPVYEDNRYGEEQDNHVRMWRERQNLGEDQDFHVRAYRERGDAIQNHETLFALKDTLFQDRDDSLEYHPQPVQPIPVPEKRKGLIRQELERQGENNRECRKLRAAHPPTVHHYPSHRPHSSELDFFIPGRSYPPRPQPRPVPRSRGGVRVNIHNTNTNTNTSTSTSGFAPQRPRSPLDEVWGIYGNPRRRMPSRYAPRQTSLIDSMFSFAYRQPISRSPLDEELGILGKPRRGKKVKKSGGFDRWLWG